MPKAHVARGQNTVIAAATLPKPSINPTASLPGTAWHKVSVRLRPRWPKNLRSCARSALASRTRDSMLYEANADLQT